jgi:topoisomerase IV subunit A
MSSSLRRTLIREIEADAKQFGDERRTLIQAEKRAVAEVKIVDEPMTVIASLKGWVRTMKGHEVDVANLSFKAGDGLYGTFACRSVDTLYVLGSSGRAFSVPVASLPGGRGDGVPVSSLIELEAGTQVAHLIAGPAEQVVLLANTGGFGLLARLGDLASRQKAGKSFLSLDEADRLLPPALVAASHAQVACLSVSGRLLVFPLSELKLQSNGGRGLTLMEVDAKDALLSVASCGDSLRVLGSGRSGQARDELVKGAAFASHQGKRGRKGHKVDGVVRVARVLPG